MRSSAVGLVLVVAFLLALASNAGLAQSLRPILVVRVEDGKVEKTEPLALTAFHVDTRILGFLAETRMTMTFSNPHNRVLAGDLYFPLPEGATVSGYALDINGVMVDGVVVEKQKGRQVYEKIVRMGIDPGLVEWVKGNSFKTRVFPIPAKGERTIRVDYTSEVDGEAFRVPLAFKDKVGDFKLRIEVAKAASAPAAEPGAPVELAFAKRGESYVAETAVKDADLAKDIVIRLAGAAEPKVLVEKAADGNVYFCVNDLPEKHARTLEKMIPSVPNRITLFWDASGSREKADHEKEFAFLRAYFGQPHLGKTTVEVDLVLFRDTAAKPERFVIKDGDVAGLVERLKAVKYDGGTQMASVAPGVAPPADFCLLFTDGISNFGQEDPGDLGAPVYVVSSGAANHPFLRCIAMKTGGVYFNLDRVQPAEAGHSVGIPSYAFLSASTDEAQARHIYPQTSEPAGRRVAVVGQLYGEKATVTLRYGSAGKPQNTLQYEVALAGAAEGDLLRRFWAQKKLEDLMIRAEKNADEITKLGKEHGIVTPGTSLIVLDSLEQYVEHGIRPPKSLPEMRAKWEEIIEARGREREKNEKEKIDRVVALWQERVKWWEMEFKYPKNFKYQEPKEKGGNGGGGRFAGAPEGVVRAAAPAPAALPAREPTADAPPAREERGGDADRMVLLTNGTRSMDAAGGQDASKADTDAGVAAEPGIAIKAWDPKTPYLDALKAAPRDKVFAVYLEQRKEFGGSPAFFLDCADFLLKQNEPALAMQVLSNVAEMELENPALLRILAHRLAQLGRPDLAAMLFEEVLRLRPEEPQSYRDLALVLAQQKEYRRAIELLYKVVLGKWDRFEGIELIALMELNALIPKAKSAGVADVPVDPRLVKLLDVDIRIVLTWDADMTDIDLWVTEPSGEKAFYGHQRTTIGGNVSRDFTQGYGPEEYCLRKAMTGGYKVQADYYGSGAPTLSGAVTLQLDIFTNYGRPNEQRRSITRRLTEKKEVIDIGEIEF